MLKTYYIIKASNMTLEATYRILQMKEWYDTYEQAKEVLDKGDPDIIPPGSQVYLVREQVGLHGDSIVAEIEIEPA
jgi:hypothetical protein